MKRTIALLLSAVMLLTTACNRPEETTEEPIQYWTEDSPAMLSIIDFVNSVCDESSDSYVEPSERIAVFDSDGTLYGELFPSYFDKCLMIPLMSATAIGSIPANGSSRRRNFGSIASERAISVLRLSPPLSVNPCCFRMCPM